MSGHGEFFFFFCHLLHCSVEVGNGCISNVANNGDKHFQVQRKWHKNYRMIIRTLTLRKHNMPDRWHD